jgi:hypothetical protein
MMLKNVFFQVIYSKHKYLELAEISLLQFLVNICSSRLYHQNTAAVMKMALDSDM